MITIELDPSLEQQLRQLANAQGQETSQLAQRILEEYLRLQGWNRDSAEDWAAASLALAPEVLPDETWDERDPRMDRGEVWWADLPAPVGRRPVLILTRSSAVQTRNQVVLAQITSTIHQLQSEVALNRADGMPRDCVVNCDVLLTVPKSRLVRSVAPSY